jgi:hypothetical protein
MTTKIFPTLGVHLMELEIASLDSSASIASLILLLDSYTLTAGKSAPVLLQI